MTIVNEMRSYHIPVMGPIILNYLLQNPNGVYYDGTLGGGGHADLFLQKLSARAVYIGVDRDAEALDFARKRLFKYRNIIFIQDTFDHIAQALDKANRPVLDAVLLDLGVSSHQIDCPERGFAYRPDAPLDMRMNQSQALTAKQILERYSEADLKNIFKSYGEERFSGKIARLIVRQRQQSPLKQAGDLLKIIDRCTPPQQRIKSYARIFQALRIEVNQELEILKRAMQQALIHLKPGGRIGVIAYQSLEDRLVKHFFKEQENPCACPPEFPVCVCGKTPQLKRLRPYLILPSEEELKGNPRARSAKFRVGEKI